MERVDTEDLEDHKAARNTQLRFETLILQCPSASLRDVPFGSLTGESGSTVGSDEGRRGGKLFGVLEQRDKSIEGAGKRIAEIEDGACTKLDSKTRKG